MLIQPCIIQKKTYLLNILLKAFIKATGKILNPKYFNTREFKEVFIRNYYKNSGICFRDVDTKRRKTPNIISG